MTTTNTETHRLQTTADVTLESLKNRNDLNFLSVGKKPRFPLKRALLKFQDIPESCKYVEKAEMFVYYFEAHKEMWQSNAYAPFVPRKIEVRQVLKNWTETEATLLQRLEHTNWKRSYLEFNDTDARTDADDYHTIYPEEATGYIKFDVTTMAQKWSTGEGNFGLILHVSVENELLRGREIRIYSRESEDHNPYINLKCWTTYCAPSSRRRGGTGDGEERGGVGERTMLSGNSSYMLQANTYQQDQEQ